jgi:hypothetical protein
VLAQKKMNGLLSVLIRMMIRPTTKGLELVMHVILLQFCLAIWAHLVHFLPLTTMLVVLARHLRALLLVSVVATLLLLLLLHQCQDPAHLPHHLCPAQVVQVVHLHHLQEQVHLPLRYLLLAVVHQKEDVLQLY